MMAISRNVLANYAGRGTVALLALSLIPVYVRALGPEGYGLIGIYTALYAVLMIVDSAVQVLLSRTAAQAQATGERAMLADRMRSLELLLGSIGLVLVTVFAIAGEYLATGLNRSVLTEEAISFSFLAIGVVLALRLYEGVYRACLMGLDRQVLFNGIFVVSQCLLWAGAGVVVTWFSPTVEAFFVWHMLIVGLTVLMLGLAAYRSVGGMGSARVRLQSLWGERRFIAGLVVISAAAVLLTQTDKFLLVKLLPLAEYGDYVLAATAAGALMLLVAPVADAIYPRLVRHRTTQDTVAYAADFHLGAQWVTVTVGAVACAGGVFALWVLEIWTGDSALALRTAPLFQILLLGNLLNAFMWMPYRAQLAAGWSGLAVRINLVAVLCLVPLIIVVVPKYGALGAAWIWVILNAGYVLVGAHFMFRRLLIGEKMRWYRDDIAKPLFAAALPVAMIDVFAGDVAGDMLRLVVAAMAALLGVASALSAVGRLRIWSFPRKT